MRPRLVAHPSLIRTVKPNIVHMKNTALLVSLFATQDQTPSQALQQEAECNECSFSATYLEMQRIGVFRIPEQYFEALLALLLHYFQVTFLVLHKHETTKKHQAQQIECPRTLCTAHNIREQRFLHGLPAATCTAPKGICRRVVRAPKIDKPLPA